VKWRQLPPLASELQQLDRAYPRRIRGRDELLAGSARKAAPLDGDAQAIKFKARNAGQPGEGGGRLGAPVIQIPGIGGKVDFDKRWGDSASDSLTCGPFAEDLHH
jgi:hypothetical protein